MSHAVVFTARSVLQALDPPRQHVIRKARFPELFVMARYVASVESLWEREAAFAHLADFASIAEWDPNVAGTRPLDDSGPELGARYEVRASMLGREVPQIYEIVEIDPPRKVVLRAETATAISRDEMTFDLRPGGGTIVTYDAELRLRGPLKLAELPLRLAFRRLGDQARDGLRRRLLEAEPNHAGPIVSAA